MREKMGMIKEYKRWKERAFDDADVIGELSEMEEDEQKRAEAFGRELTFGTGGLRSIIGAGTNRLNVYTVAKASQGVSDYIKKNFLPADWKVAIAYDSRIKSDLFAQVAAGVFAANDITVWFYEELMPTPCVSFAVRKLLCAAGIVITASHNPAEYNGYKVYGADGCQITTETAKKIQLEIQKLDIFDDVKKIEFQKGIQTGKIRYIPKSVNCAFIESVKAETLIDKNTKVDKSAAIVYSPLNGTGRKPVMRVLSESGYTNICLVKEQEQPDGNFPTCPYPNPEVKEAMDLGIQYAKKQKAELLLATDPDCDRLGIAVKDRKGEYQLLSGDELGILLLDYICFRRTQMGNMPKHPIVMKTIVTTDIAERIARDYGVTMMNVLTGFKFIGEKIGYLEQRDQLDSFLFGLEESYGYLSGTYVRDKDGVNAAFLTCEMFAYYRAQGIGLYEKLMELYERYGYCMNTQHCFHFGGIDGQKKMEHIMDQFRKGRKEFAGKRVIKCMDYAKGLDDLPRSNVLKFLLEDNGSITIRPSGTEPKLKIYLSICGESFEEAEKIEKRVAEELERVIYEKG